jgi:ribosomal protein S18 acetylase RimI-like enzyme
MPRSTKYSISAANGESLQGSAMAEKIIALDRKNMEPILREAGLEFPEQRRRTTLFHPSNEILIATIDEDVVGYVDFIDDPKNPGDLYLSSIQIEPEHRGGRLFKLLASHLLESLRSRNFSSLRTNVQKSNSRMIAIATKAGFTLEENPKSPATLDVFADRRLLDSPRLTRLFALK